MMKKEILIKSVITIDEKGNDWFYDSNYCSQFETVKDLYYHFYELIRNYEIKSFFVLDSEPVICGASWYNEGNTMKEGVNYECKLKKYTEKEVA